MKILYVAIDTPIPGTHGGSVHALELCRGLARRGHEVHIVAPRTELTRHPDGVAIGQTDPSGRLEIHNVTRPRKFLEWTAVTDVERHASRFEPDVVIDRFYTFGGSGIWAAHRLGIPSVLEVNSPARSYPGSWRDRLDRLSLVRPIHRWRSRLLSWSAGVYTTSRCLLPPDMQDRATVVTNGVDIDRFRPGPLFRAGDGPLRCVYTSSFRAWHGAEDLVRAVAACTARGVDLQVTCLGTGPRWSAARQMAVRVGVTERIRFVGQVPFEQVPKYLADADVGLAPFDPSMFPALQLGWFWSPVKIFEYLACGLAVVTIGIEELRRLLPGSVARFYAPGDVQGLAEVLEALASHPDTIQQARDERRRLVESRYSWNQQARAVEQLLLDVTAPVRMDK